MGSHERGSFLGPATQTETHEKMQKTRQQPGELLQNYWSGMKRETEIDKYIIGRFVNVKMKNIIYNDWNSYV